MPDDELTPYARIRNAALELFAARGVKGTTIRDVARKAGVSPGLVQHHFKTKAELRRKVNEFVLADAQSILEDLPPASEERSAEFAARVLAMARARPWGFLYFARLVSEGDEVGLAMFEGLATYALPDMRRMEEAGQLVPGLDLEWASIHVVMFNLASFLFEPAISRTLGEPFLSDEGLERWNRAATVMLTRAILR